MAGPSIDLTQLSNPATPMAFLSPDQAFQVTIVNFISVGSAAVLVWDFLDNITWDYRLVREFRIRLPTVTYFISRLASLYYVLACTVINTAAITDDCARFDRAISVVFPIAINATSLLFFLRTRAIYDRDRLVVFFFGFLWLLVAASSLTVPLGITVANIGPTKFCAVEKFEGYVAAAAIVPLIYDTLIFIAISWRLMTDFLIVEHDIKTLAGVKALVRGDFYFPAFSKSLYQDGQVYYLTTITCGLTTTIILCIPGMASHIVATMFAVPNLTLMNIMACRVFRKTKFGIFRETSISTSKIMPRENNPV